MKHTRLYLCRHGSVSTDGRRRYNGHRDVDITAAGVTQMESLRERLKDAPLAAIYSSDLMRTIRGAQIIGEYHDAPRIIRPELRERSAGDWEGMTFEEIAAAYPAEWKSWLDDIVNFRPPGAESFMDVADRALPALKDIVGCHAGEEVLLIGHGGVNRAILADAMGLALGSVFRIEQDFGSLNIIDYYDDGMSVVKLLNG